MPWNKDYDNPNLGEAEAIAIVNEARRRAPQTWPRKYAYYWAPFFAVLWYTGRRVGEVLPVEVQDVQGDQLWYTPEKTRDPRRTSCFAPPWLVNEILELHRARPRARASVSRVFPFTHATADQAVKRIALGAGISRHVHLHMFRHGHGRHLAKVLQDQGTPADIIQGAIKRALGHASYSTTRGYLEPSKGELAGLQERAFGPRDRR